MERTNEVKRSELWEKIYHIISQIPRRETNGLDCVDPSSASTQIEKLLEPLATDNTLPPEPEDVLRKIEDKYVCRLEEDAAAIAIRAMQEYAQQSILQARNEAIQECIPLIEKCEKTIGLMGGIIQSLQNAHPAELPELVEAIDIDMELTCAKIKDEVMKLKK